MNKRLLIVIDQEIIKKAKEYAKQKNLSLSNIIENYLKSLTKKEKAKQNKISPLIKTLKGTSNFQKILTLKKKLKKN